MAWHEARHRATHRPHNLAGELNVPLLDCASVEARPRDRQDRRLQGVLQHPQRLALGAGVIFTPPPPPAPPPS
jgi:hypothetical protein